MVDRSFTANDVLQQEIITPGEGRFDQPQHGLNLGKLIILACLGFAICVMGVIVIARLESVPQFVELPEIYLPGNPLPDDLMCYYRDSEPQPRCVVHFLNDELHFTSHTVTGLIDQTIIPALKYTLGDLILAWGTPRGVLRSPQTTFIFWGKRSIVLYTGNFRPGSRVQYILYSQEPLPASPWRGFQHVTG